MNGWFLPLYPSPWTGGSCHCILPMNGWFLSLYHSCERVVPATLSFLWTGDSCHCILPMNGWFLLLYTSCERVVPAFVSSLWTGGSCHCILPVNGWFLLLYPPYERVVPATVSFLWTGVMVIYCDCLVSMHRVVPVIVLIVPMNGWFLYCLTLRTMSSVCNHRMTFLCWRWHRRLSVYAAKLVWPV